MKWRSDRTWCWSTSTRPSRPLERVDLLERVVTTCTPVFAAQGLELPVPSQRLASAYFAEHHDYLEFLRAENREVFRSTRGYFHPTLNAVIAYDARSSGALKQSREPLAARRRELSAWKTTLEQLPRGRNLRIQLRGEGAHDEPKPGAKYLEDSSVTSAVSNSFSNSIAGPSTWAPRPTRWCISLWRQAASPRARRFPALAPRGVRGPVRGDPRGPLGRASAVPRPPTPRLAGDPHPRRTCDRSFWSRTTVSVAVINAAPTLRPWVAGVLSPERTP